MIFLDLQFILVVILSLSFVDVEVKKEDLPIRGHVRQSRSPQGDVIVVTR